MLTEMRGESRAQPSLPVSFYTCALSVYWRNHVARPVTYIPYTYCSMANGRALRTNRVRARAVTRLRGIKVRAREHPRRAKVISIYSQTKHTTHTLQQRNKAKITRANQRRGPTDRAIAQPGRRHLCARL